MDPVPAVQKLILSSKLCCGNVSVNEINNVTKLLGTLLDDDYPATRELMTVCALSVTIY